MEAVVNTVLNLQRTSSAVGFQARHLGPFLRRVVRE